MDVDERDGGIVFLRKLKEGPAAESYGLHAASLAGLSEHVLNRAAEIMATFSRPKQEAPPPVLAGVSSLAAPHETERNSAAAAILSELGKMETNAITPLEALNLIHRWKKLIESGGKGRVGRGESRRPTEAGIKVQGPSLFD